MKHLSEEQLVEHFYGKERRGVRRHLASCAACAEAFAALQSDLGAVSAVEPPARDGSYGERVWLALAPSLPVYKTPRRRWLHAGLWRGLSYAAACMLLVAGAFFAGRQWEHWQTRTTAHHPVQTQQNAVQPQPRVVVVVLSDHLERSERLLVELKHADADSEEMVTPLRDEARTLLAANRICRQDAEKIDDPALAPALDRLDALLAELAGQKGSLNAADLTRLQDEMDTDGLLFQLRVLRTRIPDQRAATPARQHGGTI